MTLPRAELICGEKLVLTTLVIADEVAVTAAGGFVGAGAAAGAEALDELDVELD